MPYLCIRTNKAVGDQPGQALLKKGSGSGGAGAE